MATSFDRWENDPFFPAAEEVQESADRMESVYRRWIQESKYGSTPDGYSGELRRELHTALGTAKWQLEELERAVVANDELWSVGEATQARHQQFVAAIADRVSIVECSLKESNLDEGGAAVGWAQLDEGERDELALFLSCALPERKKAAMVSPVSVLEAGSNAQPLNGEASISRNSNESRSWDSKERVYGNQRGNDLPQMNGEASANSSKNSRHSKESSSRDTKEKVVTASTSRRIPELRISILNEGTRGRSLDERSILLPSRMVGFAGLTKIVEAATKARWYRRNLRGGHQHDAAESIPLRDQQSSRDINACYERSKSCLNSCEDGSYDKQIHGWAGAFNRQLQRSQYQIQYGGPLKLIILAILSVLLIVLFVLRAS